MRKLVLSDGRLAALIFAAALAVLMIGSRSQGNVRDEGYYFDAAELYWSWYGDLGDNILQRQAKKSFTRAALERGFGYNHEHPALMKTLFGASWRWLHRCDCPRQNGRHPIVYPKRHATLGLLSEQAAMRLPAHAAAAALATLVFLMGATLFGRGAGLLAAALALLAPRFFFDAQLACFDAPIAALWFAVVYAYWRALGDRNWGWRLGVVTGLALATKHNAFFLPFVLGAHWLWIVLSQRRRPPIAPLMWMATLGPAIYFACWPWLWFDTIQHFREYVAFHVHHVHYNIEYLGRNYNKPPAPLSYPYVMMLLTLPVTTLALALGGAAVLWRRWRSGPSLAGRAEPLLIGLNAVFPMAILTVSGAPIFGATKHWHASIPFLALLAAAAFQALAAGLASRGRAVWAPVLGLFLALPAAVETWRSHPYGLSHYNLLAGGPAGGADLGLNRQFWGYATLGVMPWINAHAGRSEPIYWHDTNQAQLNMDVREGLLRDDLRNTGLEEPGVRASALALVLHELHFSKYEYWIWDFYGTAHPALVLDHEGVPIVTLYKRPGRDKQP